MQLAEHVLRRTNATAEFADREKQHNAEQVVYSLSYGLTTLRDLLFRRIHEDVERDIGKDSMLLPVSPLKMETKAKGEIEIFEIAESALEAAGQGYISDENWYVQWLSHLRLGDRSTDASVQRRLERYLSGGQDQRRLGFSNYLARSYPEAIRAPLVLHRLFPPAVKLVTAIAFGDHLRAGELRNQQVRWLPSIQDCYDCHGRALDNGEKCQVCGNPVWYYKWLKAAD